MTFDRHSSAKFEDGHHRSHVTPLIGGFCPPPLKIHIPPISTNPNQIFTHDFDWDSSSEFENRHHSSHETPANRGVSAPPENANTSNFDGI